MAERVLMIALTPTMEEGKIVRWNKKVGDEIAEGESICEVETDKSSMEYEALNVGTLLRIVVEEGGSSTVGQTIAIVGTPGEDVSKIEAEIQKSETASKDKTKGTVEEESNTISKPDSETLSTKGRVKASPLARKIAQIRNIDLLEVSGSGPGGRILKRDVENFSPSTDLHDRGDISIPIEGARAVIARRLSESKFSAPHFYLKSTIRMENIITLRNAFNNQREREKKTRLSMNAFFIKFAAEAIKRNPIINSSWQTKNIVQYGSIDIGLAVDLGTGLLTPIVRNCGGKGIVQIDTELQALIQKVKDRTISASEYTGATFTVSNLGSFGVDEFTAIINPPGSAIMAIGRTRKEPVVEENGSIGSALVMTVTLSCDHRVIDGSAAAKYITTMKTIFEQPAFALA